MDTLVQGLAIGYRTLAALSDAEKAMFDFSIKLTKKPDAMQEADIERLRDERFSDAEIHEIVEVVACFNYFNRLTNSLGVPLESEWLTAT